MQKDFEQFSIVDFNLESVASTQTEVFMPQHEHLALELSRANDEIKALKSDLNDMCDLVIHATLSLYTRENARYGDTINTQARMILNKHK